MTGDEARAKLDEYLRSAHGLCEHDVVMSKPKGVWVRRVPCDWPDCANPIHEFPFARKRLRHPCFWPAGGEVWITLLNDQIRTCAAAAACERVPEA